MDEQLQEVRRKRQQDYAATILPTPVYPTMRLPPPPPLPPGRVGRLQVNRADSAGIPGPRAVSGIRGNLSNLLCLFARSALGADLTEDDDSDPDTRPDEYQRNLNLVDVPTPLTRGLTSQLPEVPYQETSEADYHNCAVCLMDYEQGEPVLLLPCLHRFHPGCIKTWFDQKSTCPVCKLDVRTALQGQEQ